MTTFLECYGQGCGQPGRDWFHPLSGWFLVQMMRLEEVRPGILSFATRASPLWRNAVAAALSAGVLHSPESFLLRANGEVGDQGTDAQVAGAFMQMKPVGILEAAYSEMPVSLPAILKRVGSSLLNTPQAYVRLVALLESKEAEGQARRRVLEKLDARLDDELIQVVDILGLGILSPRTAMAVRTASEAHKLNARIPIIQRVCSSATTESLKQSIEDATHFRVSNWVRGWLGRADQLPRLGIPLDDDPSVTRITPSTARSMGRAWENCLAGHSTAMAIGATAYFAVADLNVIAVVTRTDGGWLLSGLHGRANFPVSAETAKRAKERLGIQGVICLMPAGPPPELGVMGGTFMDVDDLDFEFPGMSG